LRFRYAGDIDDRVALVTGFDFDIDVGARARGFPHTPRSVHGTLAKLFDGSVERHHWMT